MNNHGSRKSGPRRGPGKIVEKPKNFSLSLNKLFGYLKSFIFIIIISVILSALSSICSIIGPNKLKDLTDELSKALIIDKDKLNIVVSDIKTNLNEQKINDITKEVIKFNIDNNTISYINLSNEIPSEDKLVFNNLLSNMNSYDRNTLLKEVTKLPKSIINIIFEDSNINNVLVSKNDKVSFISLILKYDNFDEKNITEILLNMPKSIQSILLPTSYINNILVTTEDKIIFISNSTNMNNVPKSISNIIKPKLNMTKINKIVLFMFILYFISALFNFIQSIIMSIMSNRFAMQLRDKISKKINKLPLKYFDMHAKGDILSRVTNDIDTVGHNLSHSLGSLVGAITLFIGSIIMMFKTNYIMAVTAILSSLFGFLFMSVILSKSQKYFKARQEELGKLNGHIEEIYSNHNIVKTYNGKNDASRIFDELNESVFNCNRMSQFLSGLMPSMMNFIGNLGYVCVCIVGALLVIDNKISFGVIVAFMIYVRLFTSPLSQIAQGMSSIQSTLAASERVFEFIEEKEMSDESKLKKKINPKKVAGSLEFKHVKFGYNDDKVIIKDFNCKVKPGSKIAIVGPTGAGKTTIVNLLMKFYDINSGDILIDGVSIKEIKRENIHDLFIMVLQDTWLFEGTIRDNIKYNKKNITDEKIMETLKLVGIDHFVKSLPLGLDYIVKDNDSVSQGEKQLLTITRGMIKDAPFLILDEATSSVDTRTEELVQKAMDKLTKGRTSFIIAHRLSTIKNADLILVMKDGNIIEQGNHKKLMEDNGFYAELYNSQFKN